MTITHTFTGKVKAFPEAIRRYLDRTPSPPAPPSNGRPEAVAAHYPPRLKLKPEGMHSDYLDGAWWPRSTDLATELPDLLTVLATRLRALDRIVFDPDSWSPAPQQVTVGGHSITLEPYRFQLRNTMYVVGTDTAVMVLRVILPATDDHIARAELVDAGTPGTSTHAPRGRRDLGTPPAP